FATAQAQTQKFPIYQDLALAKPIGTQAFAETDFVVDKGRITHDITGSVVGDQQALGELADYLLSDPLGRAVWIERVRQTIKVLDKWDFDRKGFDRYVYQINQLQELSLVYLFSGHKALGEFI